MKIKPMFAGIILLSAIVGIFFLFSMFLSSFLGLRDNSKEKGRVAVINIENIITKSDNAVRQIKKYSEDSSIKAIVLRIDSPGGAVAPSQEIYSALLNLRENSDKKVITSMGNLAASGGYYIACASDLIIANPGTLTGSIGVIMNFANVEKLMEKVGLKSVVVKSGKFKDIGSPVKKFSDDDRQIVQGVIDDVYDQFVNVVAKGRNLDVQKVKELSDGRIFTGRQALKMGLVDKMGSFEDAIELAAQMAGIEGKPRVVYEKKDKNILFRLLENKVLTYLPNRLQTPSGLQFLWQY